MNLKQRVSVMAALVYLFFLAGIAAAEVSGINVMSVYPVENAPQMYFEVRALDSTGAGVRTQQQDFRFTAGSEEIELTASPVSGGNQGHIIVVDTSLYYYGSQKIKIENIRDVVTDYLSRLSGDERVMFVLTSNANRPTCTNYMALDEAKEYAQGIVFGQDMSAKINTAIYEAFQCAVSPAQGAPMFNSVFVVADPDLKNNQDNEHSLNECVQLRTKSGRNFDVAVAVLHRENFLKDTSVEKRRALNDGFAKYENFAQQCGGKYMAIPQDNEGVDTDELHAQLSQWLYTTCHYSVDFSALSGHIETEPQVQKVDVHITCSDAGGNAVRSLVVELDTKLLPAPELTPEPTALQPTPVPAPTPVVVVGQTDSVAMQAVYALTQMNYLNKSTVKEFDNGCFLAYIDFCQRNGIEPRDGIYEETYALMLSGDAIAAVVETPIPTATPVPTIPPEGYTINDQDTETSGGYIAQMQAILKELNCYEEEASSNVGRLDQMTLDAVNKYCEAFNWRNDHANGVSREICSEILTNGPKLSPLEKAEPTAQEKARAFLMGTTQIVQFAVPNWMLVAGCFALVIVIAVICILLKPGKNAASSPDEEAPESRDGQFVPNAVSPENADSDDPTADPYNNKFIRLEISYAGNCRSEEVTLRGNKPFTIGRKDSHRKIPDPDLALDSADKSVSRGKHAALMYKNGQVYVHDESSYHNTMLNGLTVFEHEGRDGMLVSNGDEITLSSHTLKVRW